MKLIYKPFGIVFGILAGILSKKLFEACGASSTRRSRRSRPRRRRPWPKVIGAAAVQGVTSRSPARPSIAPARKGFAHLTGFWPGEKAPDESEAAEAVR